MDPNTVFLICNYGVLPAWLLLALAPHHPITQKAIHQVWIPCLLALFYIWAFVSGPPPQEGAGMESLAALSLLFQNHTALLAGWIHYIAFDLFVGAWLVRDAKRQGINHWLVVPCLVATLMAGPIGLLLYSCLRFALKQQTSLNEVAA